MKKYVTCSRVSGQLEAPPSKSVAIRAIAIAAQKHSPTQISGLHGCEDIESALQMAAALGVSISKEDGAHLFEGALQDRPGELCAGESALAFRAFAPIVARLSSSIFIDARGSLLKRSQQHVVSTLEALGVHCTSKHGYPPFYIKGPISQNACSLDGRHGSQLVSGLLLAMAQNEQGFRLKLSKATSKPYIDLSLEVLESFGIRTQRQAYEEFYIPPHQLFSGDEYRVEGDYSASAFLAVLAATKGELKLANLKKDSRQADLAILDALRSAGALCDWYQDILIVRQNTLVPFTFDATDCPDLFPPLVALAAQIKGTSIIKGSRRLYHKESNRALGLIEVFGRLGVEITESEDSLIIKGGTLRSGTIDPLGDHRLAMAAAVCAGKKISIGILNSNVVNKSYRNFFQDLKKVGGTIE
jgi:3-phosphoshikimate 1-carboxyvinyltransferase